MKPTTDIEQVKSVARALLMTEVYKTPYSPMVVQHPFTSSGFVATTKDGVMQLIDITESEENLQAWQSFMRKQINSTDNAYEIYMMTNKPYSLTFLKYASPYLSKADFSKILADAWIRSENPNCDTNVSKSKLEESVLHEAIMNAISRTAKENAELLKTLKLHIGMGLDMGESEDESLDLQIKIAEIDAEFKAMLNAVSSDTVDTFDEQRVKELMDEKSKLQQQLAQIAERKQKRENTKSRLDEIFTIIDGLRNRPMEYDDRLVRQIIECVVVEDKERIKVVFIGGLEITETLINNI